MPLRLAVVLAIAFAASTLFTVQVTLTALQLVALLAWAVGASSVAIVLWLRIRESRSPERR